MAAQERSAAGTRDAGRRAGSRSDDRRRSEGQDLNTGRLVASVALATLVGAFGVRTFVAQRVEAQQAENKQLEAALRPLRRETAEVDALRDMIADYFARSQVAKVLAEESSPAAEAFAELSRLPREIVLTHAQANGMQLVATGVARTEAATRQMLEQLGAMRYIMNPRIAKIDPAPAHDPYGPDARVFQLEADLRH